jgi:hypothetical protein
MRTWLRARLRTGLRTTMQTMRERKMRTAMTERPPVVQMIPVWMDGRHDGVQFERQLDPAEVKPRHPLGYAERRVAVNAR